MINNTLLNSLMNLVTSLLICYNAFVLSFQYINEYCQKEQEEYIQRASHLYDKLIIDHLIYLLYCKVYVSAGSNTDRLTNVRVLDLEIFSLKSNHEKIHTFLCMIPIGEKTMLIVVEY